MITSMDIDAVTEVPPVHLAFSNELTAAIGLGSTVPGVWNVSRNRFRFENEILRVVYKPVSLRR